MTKHNSSIQNLDLFTQTTPCDCVAEDKRQWAPVFSLRLVRERELNTPIVTSPEDIARVLIEYLEGCDREHFVIAMLSARSQLIGVHTCHIGALTSCIVSARDVFKIALMVNAASIIVGHNHPSGNLEPSREDIKISRQLVQAGRMIGVEVLDSLIIGFDGGFTSLSERGLMA